MKVIPLVNMFIMEELDSFSKYTHRGNYRTEQLQINS